MSIVNKRINRLIQLLNEQGEVMLMQTTLTDEEIQSVDLVYADEQYSDMDYEEKFADMSEKLNVEFERVYYEEIYI